MEQQWRTPSAWQRVGAESHKHPAAPNLPKRPQVRVRAVSDRRFMLDGEIVPEGETVLVDADDAPYLLAIGKAVLV